MQGPGWTGQRISIRLDDWRARLKACCAGPSTAGAATAAGAATVRRTPPAAASVQQQTCSTHRQRTAAVGAAAVPHIKAHVSTAAGSNSSTRRHTVSPARAGGPAGPTYTSDSSTSSAGGGSGGLSNRIRDAPSAVGLLDVIYDLAADPRPHLITEAWVKLAYLASQERSSGPRRAGSWGWGPEGDAGGAGAAARHEHEQRSSPHDLRAACHALEPLTSLKLDAMQFSQVSGLMWAWARLSQRLAGGGGAAVVPPALVTAAAARAAQCPTAAEEAGRVVDAVVQLARLAWGAAVLRVRQPPLWRKVSVLAVALVEQAGPWEAASLMWALARARTLEGAAAEALCARLAVLGPQLGPADVANTVWALGAAQERRSALQQAMVAATVRLHQRLAPRELASVAWGFAQLWGTRRPAQQPGRVALLRALSAAAVACGPRLELRQAATIAWALAALGRQEPRTGRVGATAAASCGAAVDHAVGALLNRAAKLGLKESSQRDVGMLLQVVVKGTGSSSGPAPAPVIAALIRGAAQGVLAAPQSDLQPGEVAMLLWGFWRSGLLGGSGSSGTAPWQAPGDAELGAAVAAVLVPRAATFCEGPAFAPSDLPRVVAALGALAAPSRMQLQWMQGGSRSSSSSSASRSNRARSATYETVHAQATAALEQLALPLAAVAGRYKLRELADAVSGYAVAGLHPEELFDVVSEVAQRPRILDRAKPWECVRLLWAFAAADHPDEPLFATLCDALVPLLPHARPATVSRMAWACATAGYDDEDLLSSIAARAANTKFLSACQPRDVAALAWALSVAELPMRGPARAERDAALSALASTGAAMLGEGRLSSPQLASLCWGIASAGTCDLGLLSNVAEWVVARAGDAGVDRKAVLVALADISPSDAASLAWSLAHCRHVSGDVPHAALLALAARCAAAGRGDCTPEDACRAAWALAWSGIFWLPPGPMRSDGEPMRADASAMQQRRTALALARELAGAAAADPDDLEAADLASLAMALCLTGAAAQFDRGCSSSSSAEADTLAAEEATAREQLERVHACAAGWGPGVFSAEDAHLLYTSHEWLHTGSQPDTAARHDSVDGGDTSAVLGGLPPKLLAAGKRAAVRQAAATRGSSSTRAALAALKAAAPTATVCPALPESIAASARSAAQLTGLGPEQLLPQIMIEGSGIDPGAKDPILVVVASDDQESATARAAPCGWAAAAATLLAVVNVTSGSISGAVCAPRVLVLLASELEAAQRSGGDAAVAQHVRSRLASCV